MRRLLGLALAVMGVVALASPAEAESWDRGDPRHDGFRGGEITGLAGGNRASAVVARVKFAELKRNRIADAFLVVDTRRRDDRDYMVFTHWTGRQYKTSLLRTVPFSDAPADRVRCPRMRVQWSMRRDAISLSLPQRCLPRPNPHVRLGFYSGSARASDWAPGGFAQYGPWLKKR